MDIELANKKAVDKMMEAHPILIGLGKSHRCHPRDEEEPVSARWSSNYLGSYGRSR